MKKSKTTKTSKVLDQLFDDIYNLMYTDGKYYKFKPFVKRIADIYYENEYLGVAEYANCGASLMKISTKTKKPIYMLFSKRSNVYAFFVDNFSSIKKKLLEEKSKLDLSSDLKGILKLINILDAAILAYLSLAPKPLKEISILNLLSAENLSLGKCILNEKGKYSKEVLRQANIYREWAIYKKSQTPKRKNLNLDGLK